MSLEIKTERTTGTKRALENPQDSGLPTKQPRYAFELDLAIDFFNTGLGYFKAQDAVQALHYFNQALNLPFTDADFRGQILTYKAATLCELIKKAPIEHANTGYEMAIRFANDAFTLSKNEERRVKILSLEGEIHFNYYFKLPRTNDIQSKDLIEKSIVCLTKALELNEKTPRSDQQTEGARINTLLQRSNYWLTK